MKLTEKQEKYILKHLEEISDGSVKGQAEYRLRKIVKYIEKSNEVKQQETTTQLS